MKIHDKKLIIFDEEKYQKKNAEICLTYGDGIILGFKGDATLTGIYGSAEVSYKASGLTDMFGGILGGMFGDLDILKGVFKGPELNKDDPNVKKIYEKVKDPAEAERLARARLREANKNEFTASVTLMGSFAFVSGNTIFLKDFGLYDGKWIISRADHTMSNSGYVTNCNLHRCLEW